MGYFDDILIEEEPRKPAKQASSSGFFDDILGEDEASRTKREYVEQGGKPEDVYSPERLQTLVEQGPAALAAEPPLKRQDGSIAGPTLPTEEALAKGLIEKNAEPAVRKAMAEGVETVSSGFDREKGVGFAVGRDEDGKVVRVEEKPKKQTSGFFDDILADESPKSSTPDFVSDEKLTPSQSAVARESLGRFAKGALVTGPAAIARTYGLVESAAGIPIQGEPYNFESTAGARIARGLEQAGERLYPTIPEAQGSFIPEVAGGLGQVSAIVAGGPIARAAGIPASVAPRAVAAGTGVVLGAGEGAQRASQAGAKPEEILTAGFLNGVTGLSEVFPAEKWIEKIDKATAGKFSRDVRRYFIEAGVEAGTEALQEAFQTTMGNLIAKGQYRPEQDVLEGAGKAALVGGTVGAIASGVIGGFGLSQARRNQNVATNEPQAEAIQPDARIQAEVVQPEVQAQPQQEGLQPFTEFQRPEEQAPQERKDQDIISGNMEEGYRKYSDSGYPAFDRGFLGPDGVDISKFGLRREYVKTKNDQWSNESFVSKDGKTRIILEPNPIYYDKRDEVVRYSPYYMAQGEKAKSVTIEAIYTDPSARGTGLAREAIKSLKSLSDETGINLLLYPTRIGKSSKFAEMLGASEGSLKSGLPDEQLVAWYKRNGFSEVEEGNQNILIYKPKKQAPQIDGNNDIIQSQSSKESMSQEQRKEKISRLKEIGLEVEKIQAEMRVVDGYSSDPAGLPKESAKKFSALMMEAEGIRFDLRKELKVEKIDTKENRKSSIPSEIVKIASDELALNRDVFDVITEAAIGTFKNKDTSVDIVMDGKNPNISAVKLYNSFNKTRDALRKEFGEKIKLYRAVGRQKTKATQNWASTRSAAMQYGSNVIEREIPIDDIVAVNFGLTGKYEEFIVGKKPTPESPAAQERVTSQETPPSEPPPPTTRPPASPEPQPNPMPKIPAGAKLKPYLDNFRRTFQDKFVDVENLQKRITKGQFELPDAVNIKQAEELYHGRTGERLTEFDENTARPLIEEISALNIGANLPWVKAIGDKYYKGRKNPDGSDRKFVPSRDIFDLYAIAKHGTERNQLIAQRTPELAGRGSGLTDAQIKSILETEIPENVRARMEPIRQRLVEMSRRALADRLAGGLINRETYDLLTTRFQDYVPLRGKEGGTEFERMEGTGTGFDVRGREIRRAEGRESLPTDVVAYAIMQSTDSIIRAEKNAVMQTAARFAEAYPDNGVIEKAGRGELMRTYGIETDDGTIYRRFVDETLRNAPNIISYKVDGVENYLRINDPKLADIMKNRASPVLGSFVERLGSLNRYFAFINTQASPEFVISNFARDLQTALVNINQNDAKGLATDLVKNIPASLKATFRAELGTPDTNNRMDLFYNEFRREGGRMTFFGLRDFATLQKQIQAEVARGGSNSATRVFGKALDFVGKANSAVENATRLATYATLRERGYTPKQSAYAARNITVNFTRKGTAGPLLNSFYLFFNANIQGSARIIQALATSKKAQRIMLGVMAFGFFRDILNRILGGEDETGVPFYDKIPEYTRRQNFVLMNPLRQGTGEYFKFPMPYGYSVFDYAGQLMASVMPREILGGGMKPSKAAFRLSMAAVDNFNPIGGSYHILQAVSPTIMTPLTDLALNMDFSGRPIMPTPNPFDPTPPPDSQRYWNNVSPVSKWVTEKINEVTGGSKARAGAVDVSPETLDYAVEFLSGAVGKFGERLVTLPFRGMAAAKGDLPLEDLVGEIPMYRKLSGRVPSYVDISRYQEMRSEVLTIAEELKIAQQEGERAKAIEIRREAQPELRMVAMVKATEQRLKELRSERRKLQETYKRTENEAVLNKIRANRERQKELMIKALDRYNSSVDDKM